MRDEPGLPAGSILGYCTNVHAGTTFEQTKENLRTYAASVKRRVSPDAPMGVGLWLSARAAADIVHHRRIDELRGCLESLGLFAFTFNGFPFGDFHGDVVKHAVYQPPWWDLHRPLYTLHLAKILVQLIPEGGEGSISTLPLGWPSRVVSDEMLAQCGELLRGVAEQLHRVEQESGRTIHVDVEPEPGCLIGDSATAAAFFQDHLYGRGADDLIRHHIRICHDTCHAAVMFEDQASVFERYRAAGIQIGKVQLSNAVRADLRSHSARERIETLTQLRDFHEGRYLHQTTIKSTDEVQFFDDLPRALDDFGTSDRAGDEWRVHYHVPVYLESIGMLKTTRDDIVQCIRLLKDSEVRHWEVETYAWNVLPQPLQVADLAEGIARELTWVRDAAGKVQRR